MANTLNYQFVRVCAGGCHLTLDVRLNASAPVQVTIDSDFMREPLSAVPIEDRQAFTAMCFKIHSAGMTRAEVRSEVEQAGGLSITI